MEIFIENKTNFCQPWNISVLNTKTHTWLKKLLVPSQALPWLHPPQDLISGTQFPEWVGISCHRNISSYETKLYPPSIGVVWSYRSGGAEGMVPSLWFLDACGRVWGGGDAQGCTWHKELTILQMQSTNQQIKSVDSCDTIKVLRATESQEEQRQGGHSQKSCCPTASIKSWWFAANPTSSAELEESLHQNLSLHLCAEHRQHSQAVPLPPSCRGHTCLPAGGWGGATFPTVPTYPTLPQESLVY